MISKLWPRRTRLRPSFNESVRKRIQERAAALAGRQDYRRGLTVLVHGGTGRRFSSALEKLAEFPPGWHRLCVSAPDFMLFGNMHDLTAVTGLETAPAGRRTEGERNFLPEPARVPQPACLRMPGRL